MVINGVEYMTLKEVCQFLDISRQTLLNWRNKNGFPLGTSFGGRTRFFDKQEILTWIDSNEQRNRNK